MACTRAGKHPAVRWGEISLTNPAPAPLEGAGYGIRTGAAPNGSGVIVVDLDSEEAADTWEKLGGDFDTFTVNTARGYHVYFRHPGFAVGNSAGRLAQGIDVRGENGFVVGPGSPHRSGVAYAIGNNFALADVPQFLNNWLRARPSPSQTQSYPGDVEPGTPQHDYHRRLYTAYLQREAEPAVSGAGGDLALFRAVQRGAYDLALPVNDVVELVAAHYDSRCDPPWGDELEERVRHKAESAKTTSTRERMEPLPEDCLDFGEPKPLLLVAPSEPTTDTELSELEKQLKITWGQWAEPMPPPVYKIAPMVPEETIGLIVAKGSSLKTWLVLSMLASVANGTPWLDRFPVTSCRTLLIDFESGRSTIQERMQYLGMQDCPNFGIASIPGARTDDPKFWATVTKIVLARGVGLIAIDSFAAGATGVDENDAKAASPLHLATTFVECTKCSVVFIHHAKKGEVGDERDLVRGSGAVYGAADWVYTMIPNDVDRTRMTVRNIKAYRKKTDDFRVALTSVGLVLDSTPEETPAAKTEDKETDIRHLLMQGPVATVDEIYDRIGGKSRKAETALASLVARRMVAKLEDGYALDGPLDRLARIRYAMASPAVSTISSLVSTASVTRYEINELMRAPGSRKGVWSDTAEQLFLDGGRFTLVPKPLKAVDPVEPI